MEKYESGRIYSVAYFDAEQQFYYIKRFMAEVSDKMQNFVETATGDRVVAISIDPYPQLEVVFGGAHASRPAERIDVDAFIGVKSHRAKGKRVTTFAVDHLEFVEPLDKDPHTSGEGNEGDPSDPEGGEMSPAGEGVDNEAGTSVGAEATSTGSGNGTPVNETPAGEVRPTASNNASAGQTSKREYVAGDSVEFDFTDEKQQPTEEQPQMELF